MTFKSSYKRNKINRNKYICHQIFDSPPERESERGYMCTNASIPGNSFHLSLCVVIHSTPGHCRRSKCGMTFTVDCFH